ncbi:hypothetical protein [Halorientalis halophila]|uniref:hypothetical protein n=1 Tax=Halorientalis halophila TaxID=3108499 RepID=UPI0030095540
MTTRVPFTPLEEAVHHIERKLGSWNVQSEVETATRIDVDRLREATLTACNAHPLARARQRPNSGTDTRFVWEIPTGIGRLPDGVITVMDGPIGNVSPFYRQRIDLTEELPFRLLVIRGGGADGGDALLVCTSHVAADGIGSLRFVRSICEAYRGVSLDPDPVDTETARDAIFDGPVTPSSDDLELVGDVVSYLGNAIDPPTRIAGDDGSGTGGSGDRGGDDGWVFDRRRLDEALTARVLNGRPEQASVNDVLLAALHRCIDGWNRDHGESSRKISCMMPVNLRPSDWFYDVVGMFAAFDSIATRPSDRRKPAATLETVVEQTQRLKDRDRSTLFIEALKLVPPGTPVALKEQFPQLLRGLGKRFLDTAVLSNLGRVPEPVPRLDDGDPGNFWFSPPSTPPVAVGIGVVTVSGRIYLTGRYDRGTFDADAAAAFTDRYLDCVGELVA